MSAVFISDLHLDESRIDLLHRFEQLCVDESRRVDAIYILGDLFEIWIGDDDESAVADRVKDTIRTASQSAQVFLVHGNRDFLIGESFADDCGARLLADPIVVEIDDRQVLIAHGDQYCTGDIAYQQMRNLFRSDDWQQHFLSQPIEERRQFAQSLRAKSAEEQQNKPENITDVTLESVRAAMDEFGCNTLIHGHVHRPGVHTDEDGRRRFVLGAWDKCGWLVRVDDEMSLECFSIGVQPA